MKDILPVFSLLVLLAFAAAALAGETAIITGIDISGNARTRDTYILSRIETRVGDPWVEGLEGKVRQLLLNTMAFYDVEVTSTRSVDGVRLHIRLKDKWSLIPFPLASVREGESAWGLSVMESNFLGLQKKLFATLVYHDGRLGESLFYTDRNLLDSDWNIFLMGQNSSQGVDEWDGDRKINSYVSSVTGATVGPGYNFTRKVSLSFLYTIDRHRFEDQDGTVSRPVDGRESMLGLLLEVDDADREEDRVTGLVGRIHVSKDFKVLGSDFEKETLGWQLTWFGNPLRDHTLSLTSGGSFGRQLTRGFLFSLDQLRGYEYGRYQADRALVSVAEYIVPLRSWRGANLSLAAFADNAVFHNDYQSFTLGDSKTDAGLSLRVYLRKIMLPVLQLYLAYGFSNRKLMPGFALGFMF